MQSFSSDLIGGLPLILGLIEGPGIGGLDISARGVLRGVPAADAAYREKHGQNGDIDGDLLVEVEFLSLLKLSAISVVSIASSTRLLDIGTGGIYPGISASLARQLRAVASAFNGDRRLAGACDTAPLIVDFGGD